MVAGVLVEISHQNIDRVFEYHIPDYLASEMKIGIRVLVPFGRMELEGFVLQIQDQKNTDKDLKDIIHIVDSSIVLNQVLLDYQRKNNKEIIQKNY